MSSQTPVAVAAPDLPAPEPPKGLRGHPWLTLFSVAIGVMMVALDGTIVAIANPAIKEDLGASLADVQWITNGYMLALAVSLITAGKLGDRFGHRQTFLIGILGFAAASGAIGFSHEVSLVIAFRVLQGLFGALLMPAALGLLRATFPAEKLNMAIGIWGMVIGASTAAWPDSRRTAGRARQLAVRVLHQRPGRAAGPGPRPGDPQGPPRGERPALVRHPGHRAALRSDVLPHLAADQGVGMGLGRHEDLGLPDRRGGPLHAVRRTGDQGPRTAHPAADVPLPAAHHAARS